MQIQFYFDETQVTFELSDILRDGSDIHRIKTTQVATSHCLLQKL